VQHRQARHFALVEFPQNSLYTYGQVVLYDTKGLEEPRVVYPVGGGYATILAAAVREDDQQLAIFVQTSSGGAVLSIDGGSSWKSVSLPNFSNALMQPYDVRTDAGGAYVRARYGRIRIGTRDVPFVLDNNYGGIYAVTAAGSAKLLLGGALVGTSRDGAQLLVIANLSVGAVDLNGKGRLLGAIWPLSSGTVYEGWITPEGGAYLEIRGSGDYYNGLYYLNNGKTTFVQGTVDYTPSTTFPPQPTYYDGTFFSVPSADYGGAWTIVRRGVTTLSFHSASKGLVRQWDDISAPEVEALYPGNSGKSVLVQVHRPRATLDQSLFKDPALAVWRIGESAPKFYDELFLAETPAKAFVHVDPDAIESGEPFVFDSGINAPTPSSGGVSAAPPGAGGSDVTQEWGCLLYTNPSPRDISGSRLPS
jgi:hypothetical protein